MAISSLCCVSRQASRGEGRVMPRHACAVQFLSSKFHRMQSTLSSSTSTRMQSTLSSSTTSSVSLVLCHFPVLCGWGMSRIVFVTSIAGTLSLFALTCSLVPHNILPACKTDSACQHVDVSVEEEEGVEIGGCGEWVQAVHFTYSRVICLALSPVICCHVLSC